MGWKQAGISGKELREMSQSAFAGYGLKGKVQYIEDLSNFMSQSAFAGYGLEDVKFLMRSAKVLSRMLAQ